MPELLPTFKKAYWTIGALVAGYGVILGLLTNPWLQRHALYAHRLHSGFWHDLDAPESFGFASKQVTPFNISTPDGETLYAWHILPLNVYAKHQGHLLSGIGPSALEILQSDPNARVVVNFHGNAGHVAQGWRTDTYRALTNIANTHVLTVDYRGFGRSTGSPDEKGLITDGVALVNHALFTAGIPATRIVILGQSLGTAVASAVALYFAAPTSALLPFGDIPTTTTTTTNKAPAAVNQQRTQDPTAPTLFAGIVLAAPFSSLPSLLLTYRIAGLVPILGPLRSTPFLSRLLLARLADPWRSADRLAEYVTVLTGHEALREVAKRQGEGLGRAGVQVLHAVNDRDIDFRQSLMLFSTAVGVEGVIDEIVTMAEVRKEGAPGVGLRILEHGGHNRIVTYAPVTLAVMRAFESAVT